MSPADQALAKQALARNDLDLLDRRERKLQRFIARGDISKMARAAAVDQLDELGWERSTVEMALESHALPDVPTPAIVALAMTQAEADHAAGMMDGPEPTREQLDRWAAADVTHDAYYHDRGIA